MSNERLRLTTAARRDDATRPVLIRQRVLRYWLLDWPSFLLRSAAASYFTLMGLAGAFLILMVAVMLVGYSFGYRIGW
jgi:hypothetical protein